MVLGNDPGRLLLLGQLAHIKGVVLGHLVLAGVEEVVEVAGVVEVPQHVAILEMDAVLGFGRAGQGGHG